MHRALQSLASTERETSAGDIADRLGGMDCMAYFCIIYLPRNLWALDLAVVLDDHRIPAAQSPQTKGSVSMLTLIYSSIVLALQV